MPSWRQHGTNTIHTQGIHQVAAISCVVQRTRMYSDLTFRLRHLEGLQSSSPFAWLCVLSTSLALSLWCRRVLLHPTAQKSVSSWHVTLMLRYGYFWFLGGSRTRALLKALESFLTCIQYARYSQPVKSSNPWHDLYQIQLKGRECQAYGVTSEQENLTAHSIPV